MRRLAKKKALTCPWCGRKNDSHSHMGGDPNVLPAEGDFTMCLTCGYWSVFQYHDNVLSIRKPWPSETLEIKENPNCQKLEKAWSEMMNGT